jgi:hypothetical protein
MLTKESFCSPPEDIVEIFGRGWKGKSYPASVPAVVQIFLAAWEPAAYLKKNGGWDYFCTGGRT